MERERSEIEKERDIHSQVGPVQYSEQTQAPSTHTPCCEHLGHQVLIILIMILLN